MFILYFYVKLIYPEKNISRKYLENILHEPFQISLTQKNIKTLNLITI